MKVKTVICSERGKVGTDCASNAYFSITFKTSLPRA